ncbi:MAG: hypothetical protein M1818_003588 [Claussenomyces sp. TS43310]|nr:MAG: hypothetical protein M1818_003588 [Claussenomyces sp. TS43310]
MAFAVTNGNGTSGGADSLAPLRSTSLFSLAGKVILVSGAARGLGLTQAEALLEAGATVYALDRLEEPSAEFAVIQRRAADELNTALHYRRIDVREVEELTRIVETIATQHGRLDGLIAAAGIQQETPALEYTAQDANLMFEINVTGVMMTAQAVAKQMVRFGRGGSIVMIASMSGTVANRVCIFRQSHPFYITPFSLISPSRFCSFARGLTTIFKGLICPAYNASKAGVIQLGRNLASEWGVYDIRVNTISPGYIATKMVEALFEKFPERRTEWPKQNMLGRLSIPEDYKGAAVFLMSDASSFMTGADMRIDGGHAAW